MTKAVNPENFNCKEELFLYPQKTFIRIFLLSRNVQYEPQQQAEYEVIEASRLDKVP